MYSHISLLFGSGASFSDHLLTRAGGTSCWVRRSTRGPPSSRRNEGPGRDRRQRLRYDLRPI